MGMPLPIYAKIKDRICISYLGESSEYVVQLNCLLPTLERELNGVEIFICCKDELVSWFNNPRVFGHSKMTQKKNDFALIKPLKFNMRTHPIIGLLDDSNIACERVDVPHHDPTAKCAICPEGLHPVKSMSYFQKEAVIEMAAKQGFEPEITTDVLNAGWVIGVECGPLYLAASKGIKTSLVPTGLGTSLYEKMFNGDILDLK